MQNVGNKVAQPREPVQAIARAGSLLRALELSPEGMGLLELSAAVGLAKSTVHRLVGALVAEELLSTSATGKIRLGAGLVRLAEATRQTLVGELRPVLEGLHRTFGETVDLAVIDGQEVRFVDQLPATHRLRAVSAIGASFPLHCTANGKALLAAMPLWRVRALLAGKLQPMTAHTIVSRSQLMAEIERIAKRGVAFDHEEHTEGICAVGAAVWNGAGPVGAISMPVPAPRFRGNQERYAQALRLAARDASKLLGGSSSGDPPPHL